jgi:hypothetical protein
LNQPEYLSGISVKKSEIPHSTESFRKNMLKNEPEKIFAPKTPCLPYAGLSFAISKRDYPVITANDVFLWDNSPIQIAGKILQRRLTGAGAFAVHNPILLADMPWNNKTLLVNSRQKFIAKDFGEGFFGKQEFPVLTFPKTIFLVESSTWNEIVNMRMEIEFSAMRMQDAGHPDVATQKPGIVSKCSESLFGRFEQTFKEHPLMRSGQ